MAQTKRSEDSAYASGGAVTQDGLLPIYIHLACGRDVVWATSRKTGRKYLVNVYRGQAGQRFYVKHQPHKCQTEAPRIKQWSDEAGTYV